MEDAVKLDRLLQKIWEGHPRYYRIGNEGNDWDAKSQLAHEILEGLYPNLP